MNVKSGTVVLPRSIQFIVDQLKEHKSLKPSRIVQIVKQANVLAEDLMPWADLDHPVKDSYGRKLVYDGGHFEIMVMSWRPGDFSAIHDHGFTQYGAVQIFGPAEHATFRDEDEYLITLNRWVVNPHDVVGVSHQLIHQMGNPTKDQSFVSLHVYGTPENVENVTGEARIFDVENGKILRVNGGVFFGLPAKEIVTIQEGPIGDFTTRLRYNVELARRLKTVEDHGDSMEVSLEEVIPKLTHANAHDPFMELIQSIIDRNGHQTHSVQWRNLVWELKETAAFLTEIKGGGNRNDFFHKYAQVYDEIVCKPCMNDFMGRYWKFFISAAEIEPREMELLSVGCGTGLVEKYTIDELGMDYEKVYGIDLSPSMVEVARQRIRADVGDVLTLDPSVKLWDIVYSGLNVFHYVGNEKMEEAIVKTASILKEGGYFLGDFITPDHIRWYPNVLKSNDDKIVSLRTPRLIEKGGHMFQESEIVNVSFLEGNMQVHNAGKHLRYLPPMNRVRAYFEEAFGAKVKLFDAISLEEIPAKSDSCPSTRYIVIAQKQ